MLLRITVAAALAACVPLAAAKAVFAHVVAGNSGSYTYANWQTNIRRAKAAGIEGFIMNIAPDTYNLNQQLDNVYKAAAAISGFSIFISFDYLGGGTPWPASTVESIINSYSPLAAQYRINGLPVVTTFEGTQNAGDWPAIKSATGGIFFIPDYSSLGAGVAAQQPAIDGLASWTAWPNGPEYMDDGSDLWYQSQLAGKPYMAPIAPWFYSNVPASTNSDNKKVERGDRLWYDRWNEIIQFQPEIVQIISWNDFGESHYIGPLPPSSENPYPGSPAEQYSTNHPHVGWLADLPYFISMYKTGAPPATYAEHITISYRTNPSTSGSDDGVVCGNNNGSSITWPPAECSLDQVNINVLTSAASNVTASIGGKGIQTWTSQPGMNFFPLPFNGLIGAPVVKVTRGGKTIASITGKKIAYASVINWNAWVGTS